HANASCFANTAGTATGWRRVRDLGRPTFGTLRHHPEERASMTDVGIGIIGAGYMARSFAECLARYTQGGRLRAVAGGTRAPATAAEFDVPALGSVEELIERRDVDAVIVTSPHADHRDQVIAAARAH